MAKGDVYYHVAPSERRASILAEGIRTLSWDGARLVTWLIDGQQMSSAVDADILTIADVLAVRGVPYHRHDVWMMRHLCEHRIVRCGTWLAYMIDIPPGNIMRVRYRRPIIKEFTE